METESSDFAYTALDLSRDSIRLIQVQAAGWDDAPISCTLRHDTTKSTYSCLSYAWGDEHGSHNILVNGEKVAVGSNLWAFLQAWRRKAHRREEWLWIDFLSIDQSNLKERNHQVQQMGSIYKSADTVYAWLGNDAVVARYLEVPALPAPGPKSAEGWQASREAMRRFITFVKVDYWKRAWITQELALARSVMLFAGHVERDLDSLPIWNESNEALLGKFQTFKRELDAEDSIAKHLSHVRAFCPPRYLTVRGRSLPYLLDQFQNKKCHDDRDRIYSLLALCAEGSKLKADYGIGGSRLLINVLRSCGDSICFCTFALVRDALGWTDDGKDPLNHIPIVRMPVLDGLRRRISVPNDTLGLRMDEYCTCLKNISCNVNLLQSEFHFVYKLPTTLVPVSSKHNPEPSKMYKWPYLKLDRDLLDYERIPCNSLKVDIAFSLSMLEDMFRLLPEASVRVCNRIKHLGSWEKSYGVKTTPVLLHEDTIDWDTWIREQNEVSEAGPMLKAGNLDTGAVRDNTERVKRWQRSISRWSSKLSRIYP